MQLSLCSKQLFSRLFVSYSEKKAKRAEKEKRAIARRAREEHRRSLVSKGHVIGALVTSFNKHKEKEAQPFVAPRLVPPLLNSIIKNDKLFLHTHTHTFEISLLISLSIKWNLIILDCAAHTLVTTTVHKALPSGGGAMGSWDGGLGVVGRGVLG